MLFLLTELSVTAQNTYYYKLTKKVKDDVTITNVSGGQFITFTDKACYESDKNGYSVQNGKLDYKYTDGGIKTYVGDSYWGSHSVFLFKNDLSALNVKTSDGEAYVYKRAMPPANVTTCSLIRKNTSSIGSSGGNAGAGYSGMPSQPVINGRGGTSTTPIKTTPGRNTPTRVWHECGLCHGKRTIVRESSVSTYGKDTQWYCNQCGRNVWRSSGHSHVTCSQCSGQGGYYTTQ